MEPQYVEPLNYASRATPRVVRKSVALASVYAVLSTAIVLLFAGSSYVAFGSLLGTGSSSGPHDFGAYLRLPCGVIGLAFMIGSGVAGYFAIRAFAQYATARSGTAIFATMAFLAMLYYVWFVLP